MLPSEEELFVYRSSCFHHCKKRLRERYGIHLNIDIWLRINNAYWINAIEHKIIHPKDSLKELVVVPMFATRLIGIFHKDILVFCTFLDPRWGRWGSAEYKHGRIITLG